MRHYRTRPANNSMQRTPLLNLIALGGQSIAPVPWMSRVMRVRNDRHLGPIKQEHDVVVEPGQNQASRATCGRSASRGHPIFQA